MRGPAWPVRVRMHLPVARSQSRAVWSPLAVASRVPSGLTAASFTFDLWPVKVCMHLPVARCQSRAVWSPLAIASRVPSGLNATAKTPSVWPVRVPVHLPVAVPHSRAVLSLLAVASRTPSGLNATDMRGPAWPVRVRMHLPVASAASSYVCPVDVAADHAGLLLVAGVVGAVEGEVPQRGELGLDAVQPGRIRRGVGDLDVIRGCPLSDALVFTGGQVG